MIVTVTPHPSVDRTIYVGRLVRGTVVRAGRTAVHPSGKGVNVARALAARSVREAREAVRGARGHDGGFDRSLQASERHPAVSRFPTAGGGDFYHQKAVVA